jgi:crotonobetainyl-CoA:carnitine CoA-transferase CaiB-like acyl-CoA transferase
MDYIANGRVQGRTGNRHPAMAPHGVFRCKGDDRWLAIAVDSDGAWKTLIAEIGDPAWARDPHFATLAGRQQHEDELEQKLGEWTKDQDAAALADRLQGRGVMAALVQCARDVFLDPQFAARRFFEPVLHNGVSALGERVYIGRPWKLSGADLAIATPAPTLGEHNRQILTGLLGYSDAEVNRLDQAGIVGSFMKGPRGTPTNPPLALDEMRKRGRIGAHDPDYRDRQKAMLT